jgi:hypothetical protein
VIHIPLVRFSRARNPDYEARRLKRRFAAIWHRYERAMTRRRRLRQAGQVALVVSLAIGSFALCWVLLGQFG